MKTTIIFIALLAISFSLPVKEDLAETMMTMVQMKSRSSDAVQAVMQVLNDLRQSAFDEEESLRQYHDNEELYYSNTIGSLQSIANTNCGIWEDSIAHREFIEAEITDTADYLDWIANRYVTIDEMIQQLKDERCEGANIFVLRIREHMEAKEAIELLKYELIEWDRARGGATFVEIEELPSFNRLTAYTNMFKANALQEFVDLASEQDDDDYLSVGRRDLGDDHEDNTQGEQVLEGFDSGTADRNVGGTVVERMITQLEDLEAHLETSMSDLRDNELRASYDTVSYIQEAEAEVSYLQTQEEQRLAYAEKLQNDLVLAQAQEAASDLTCQESRSTVASTQAELEAHRQFFMSELDRLANDVEVVDEVIRIFQQELQGIDDIIRNQVDTGYVVDDDRFSQGMFSNTDVDDSAYDGGFTLDAETQ